jgi:hypothetical protein
MINKYIKNGFAILDTSYDENYINNLKSEINSLFKNDEGVSLSVSGIDNKEIFNKIVKILNTNEIQKFTKSLSDHYKTNVSILPNFHIMRNYHVNRLKANRVGWHRDVASEFNYQYCKDKINNDKYVFGKVGIFLQENSEDFGGAVDLIPGSHLNIKKNIFLKMLSSLRLQFLVFLQKNLLNFYKLLPEEFYLFILGAKKTNAQPGSPIFFDSRVQHRGSPIKDKFLSGTKRLGDMHILVPKTYTKISIYAYFGSTDGADSYMHARTKRESAEYKKYFSGWLKEVEKYKDYKSLYNSMLSITNPLKEKYKDN